MRYGSVVVYLGIGTAWIYLFLDRGHFEDRDLWWLVAAGFALAHVALGFLVGRWPVILLPLVLTPLAVPAGYPVSQYGEPSPVWLGQMILVQAEIPLVALGVGARELVDRARAPRPRSS
jgi:hypothetical protein